MKCSTDTSCCSCNQWVTHCRSLIESALEYGDQTHTFDDIVEGVLKGEYQFWEAPLGCAITEIVVFPRKKVLHIFLYAGELQQVLDMEESAKIWAKENCTVVY